jgi:hypothetical protein
MCAVKDPTPLDHFEFLMSAIYDRDGCAPASKATDGRAPAVAKNSRPRS